MVESVSMAGNIVRRIREDAGISRATLSKAAGVSPRSLYALETGESENFGLGNFLKILSELGLSMEITKADTRKTSKGEAEIVPAPAWDDLADVWKLD